MTCDCDLRRRAWNPHTGKCETCGCRFNDERISAPLSTPYNPEMLEMYAVLVGRMREAQKAYFRTRTKQDLVRSKELEREVDRATDGALRVARQAMGVAPKVMGFDYATSTGMDRTAVAIVKDGKVVGVIVDVGDGE